MKELKELDLHYISDSNREKLRDMRPEFIPMCGMFFLEH